MLLLQLLSGMTTMINTHCCSFIVLLLLFRYDWCSLVFIGVHWCSLVLFRYPFRFRWPNTYFPEGSGYLQGNGIIDSAMKHMARIPVQRPRWPSDLSGLCTDLPDVNFKKGSVCLGTIGEAFKRPGKQKKNEERQKQERRTRRTKTQC